MARELTKKEIYERMIEWRNIKKLHAAARDRIEAQQQTIKLLKEKVRVLEERDHEKGTVIAELKLQIEELKRKVFGRRPKKQGGDGDDEANTPPQAKTSRAPDSYHRRIPTDEKVTDTRPHAIDVCADCGNPLEKLEIRVFYEEDIVLPSTADVPLKTVIKHEVERGWCGHCCGWRSAIPLPTTSVILGRKVRIYICYLSILIRLSFEQVRHLLLTTYGIEVSSGEIAVILQREAKALEPEYEALKERIRVQKGVHYDETSHPVQQGEQGNYAWAITGTETDEVVFDCGKSRGKGVAVELKGEADHVGITDDYAAYRSLFKEHQLCWAHPHRKLRELTETDSLTEADVSHCRPVFRVWSALYADVRSAIAEPFDAEQRATEHAKLMGRFNQITADDPTDPLKLARIKAGLRRGRDAYFTCLSHDGIPCDNNKAERAVRHLVLKRRISFGSRTQKGALTFSVLVSVLLSLWRMQPNRFFQGLMELRGV